MAEKHKRLDVYEIRKALMDVAEKEAHKRPDISKEELKKRLTDHLRNSEIIEHALTPQMEKLVERIIGIAAEVAVKMVEIYLREKNHYDEVKEKVKAEGPKAAKAEAKKAPAKKAAAKKKVLKKKK